jgi:hypothetical protein
MRHSPSIGKDAPVKGPEEKVEEQLAGGELLFDELQIAYLPCHLDGVGSACGGGGGGD